MVHAYELGYVEPQLKIKIKKLEVSSSFQKTLHTECGNKRELNPFYNLFYEYQVMDRIVRAHATPVDKDGKLMYSHMDFKLQDNGLVSFIPNEKGFGNGENLYNSRLRQTMKPGKFIRSFFHEVLLQRHRIGDKEIEMFSAFVKGLFNMEDFELVVISGNDIKWAYLESNYINVAMSGENASSSLTGSCMRHPKCQDWLGLYTDNERVKMLVLKHKPTGKCAARAILWHDIKFVPKDGVDHETRQINLIDRVYAYREWMIPLMLDWGSNNGYWKKQLQSINSKEYFFTPDGLSRMGNLELKIEAPLRFYPYMDTFTYLKSDKVTFSNRSTGHAFELTQYQTGNAHVNPDTTKLCSCCGNRFEAANMTAISGSLVCNTCRDEYYVRSNWYGRYILKRDAVYLDDYNEWFLLDDTYTDELTGNKIPASDAAECLNHENRFTWTRTRNVVWADGDYYLTGHPDIFLIGGVWIHKRNTFVCAHDGERYSFSDAFFVPHTGVDVKTSNLTAYLAANALQVEMSTGNIVPIETPVLEEVATESTPTVEANHTPTRRRDSRGRFATAEI
jgi:hypothetical protein